MDTDDGDDTSCSDTGDGTAFVGASFCVKLRAGALVAGCAGGKSGETAGEDEFRIVGSTSVMETVRLVSSIILTTLAPNPLVAERAVCR